MPQFQFVFGTADVGKSRGKGTFHGKAYFDDIYFVPRGVVVTSLQDPFVSSQLSDTFAVTVTVLQQGAFQFNIVRVDSDDAWEQSLLISYIAWGDHTSGVRTKVRKPAKKRLSRKV